MNKYRVKKYLMYGIPILVIAGLTTFYFIYRSNHKESNEVILQVDESAVPGYEEPTGDETSATPSDDSLGQLQNFDIFPELNSYDFYDYIRVNENGPFFTDDFIAAVTNKVIHDSVIPDGRLYYEYERVSTTVLKITFVWERPNGNRFPKVYTFTLSNNGN